MTLPLFLEYAFCASHLDFVLLCEICHLCLIDNTRSITATVQRAFILGPSVAGDSVRVNA